MRILEYVSDLIGALIDHTVGLHWVSGCWCFSKHMYEDNPKMSWEERQKPTRSAQTHNLNATKTQKRITPGWACTIVLYPRKFWPLSPWNCYFSNHFFHLGDYHSVPHSLTRQRVPGERLTVPQSSEPCRHMWLFCDFGLWVVRRRGWRGGSLKSVDVIHSDYCYEWPVSPDESLSLDVHLRNPSTWFVNLIQPDCDRWQN